MKSPLNTPIFNILITLFFAYALPVVALGPLNNELSLFYVNHKHPVLNAGQNILGDIIIKNDNPAGFKLTLQSNHHGMLTPVSSDNGELAIPYTLQFEAGSGRIGDGIALNMQETTLHTEHILLTGTSPSNSTDISLRIIAILENFNPSQRLAGHYRDVIEVHYTNY